MSFKNECIQWRDANMYRHLAANIRKYSTAFVSTQMPVNCYGMAFYPRDCKGTVVEITDDFVLVKQKPSEFTFIQSILIRDVNFLTVGDKVNISFYKPRRMDGSCAQGHDDVYPNGVTRFVIGRTTVHLPFEWDETGSHSARYFDSPFARPQCTVKIQNPYLIDLVNQLESTSEAMVLDGGFRSVSGMLIDSRAVSFVAIDPSEKDSATIAPKLLFSVVNGKFCGEVQIQYDRAIDLYRVVLKEMGQPIIIDNVDLLSLPGILQDAVCDGQWKYAKVEVVKKAPKRREAKAV